MLRMPASRLLQATHLSLAGDTFHLNGSLHLRQTRGASPLWGCSVCGWAASGFEQQLGISRAMSSHEHIDHQPPQRESDDEGCNQKIWAYIHTLTFSLAKLSS